MPRGTKRLAVVFCMLLFASISLAGCSSESKEDKKISSVKTEDSDKVGSSSSDSDKEDAKPTGADVSIEEQVIYDNKGIKITATGLDDSIFGTELKLSIENNSEDNITVQTFNANVNGYMVSTIMSVDVASGKKANDSITFETSGLKDCGIDKIATMEFRFTILDPESFTSITDSDMIKINTSIADTYVQKYDDTGNVLVDKNGIKIVGKGLSQSDSFWGPGLILYIENNSDRDITIQADDVSINNIMVDSTISEDVLVGKKAVTALQFFSSDLEENNIEDITSIELKFNIFDLDLWDTIFDTDKISIAF